MSAVVVVQASVDDLKAAISKANAKYYPSRQRLTLPSEAGQKSGTPLLDGTSLTQYKLTTGSTVVFKDLGTQASTDSTAETPSAFDLSSQCECCRLIGPQSSFGSTLVRWRCTRYFTFCHSCCTLESSRFCNSISTGHLLPTHVTQSCSVLS